MGLIDTVTKDRKLYGNCQVLSPEGHLMFRCDLKKVNWYLCKELAEVVEEDVDKSPLIIKLKFEPKGLGNHNKDYGLMEMENCCVVCGVDEFLTRHHVVPYCYRQWFPVELKSHNFHDVLSVCAGCHEKYEQKAFQFKLQLAKDYNAHINGEVINNKTILKIRRLAYCLKNEPNVPDKRKKEIKVEIRKHFNWERVSESRLDGIINMPIKVYTRTHGQVVVSKITDFKSFIRMWRNHFLENNDCKFLPKNWSIENE